MAATPPDRQRTVFYCKESYGYARVCYGLRLPGYRFEEHRALPMRRLLPQAGHWKTTRLFLTRPPGLVHTFNDIVIHARAWMVSHELELPRFLGQTKAKHIRAAYHRLADGRCRAVLPMSEAAKRWMLRRVPEALRPAIEAKTRVFTGAVNGPEHFNLPVRPARRSADQPLHLVFVGNNAFRKGGPVVLDAFDRLRKAGLSCRLTFIGRVDPHSYTRPVTPEDHADLVRRLRETPEVTWMQRVPNRNVLAILSGAHVGLLPTYDDSLGWSVIEMMSAGLPVVASNIVALPELVTDGVTGRLIDVPRDADGRWIGVVDRAGDETVQKATHEALVAGVVSAVEDLANDEDLRQRIGAAGREVYAARYTPDLAAD